MLVIGTGQIRGADGHMYEPAEHIMETGDYIIGVNGKSLKDKEELVECINASGGRQMEFQVLRASKKDRPQYRTGADAGASVPGRDLGAQRCTGCGDADLYG